MEYELIDAGPCRKKLVLKFSSEDIDKAFSESYDDINGYVQLKGFRKGKAPRRALEKRFGKEAAAGAKQQLTEKNLAEIVQKEELQIIGSIADISTEKTIAPGQPYELTVQLEVAPDFELPPYKGLELSSKGVEITDEKVDSAIDRYRKAFTTYHHVDEPAREGDVLLVDFYTRVDGQEIIGMQDQRLRVEGDILFGLPCPELVSTFTGAGIGDVKELTITLPEDHSAVELRGKPAKVEVTVKDVERGEAPELNDEFAASVGMNNLADMRERVRRNLINEAMIDAKIKEDEELIDKLVSAVEFPVPEEMVDKEADALVEQRRRQLTRSGAIEDEALERQLDTYRPEAREMALRQVKWGILARKIADKEEIKVTPEEVSQQVEALASSYNTTPAKMLKHIRNVGGIEPLVDQVRYMKVTQFITDNAVKPEGGDTESINAAAAESVTKVGDGGEAAGEGE